MRLIAQLQDKLAALDGDHRRRRCPVLDSPQGPHVSIDGRDYLAFASNDYLGLANHPALVAAARDGALRWGVGGGASHLVAGHSTAHAALEQALADWLRLPAALLFSSGYQANLAVITALVGRGDAVFADRLNHASLNDACLLSRAEFKRFAHHDLAQLERLLAASTAPTKLIAVDAVYSMDGDCAPLAALLALAERFDAWLYVDDAHGFGVLGEGRGSVVEAGLHSERLIQMVTLGKAAGVAGAAVAAHAVVIDWLVNSARPFIFTTSTSPLLAHTVQASLRLMADEPERRAALRARMAELKHQLAGLPWTLLPSDTPIQPLLIGGNAEALAVSAGLRARGIWVPAIRPPTVPPGSARLRIALSAAHQPQDIVRLADALRELAAS
ncbi:8-amino-7-oxononanoate synthase [Rivihabitans pingtungensis]|uniref:8-amino-7-oxononanoate synthase n=1 Tax=Rivihabitans pingtungensis TaxID=1054498 RepID=A0A318KIU2_9NEIS|nr:8-amino-7-oxononanoate synthase [Rivihabitans pingtungensis]PXX78034.1 8-amino-7-oxononanoate synthase [Rivihabitans pingtungensis]